MTPRLLEAAATNPAVTVTGPRQSGKSTLCRVVFARHPYANLEAPDTRMFALEDPRGFLSQFPDGALIDEIARCPDLPSYLQERIDEDPVPGRWILTGSQNLALLESVSQSLAGRTAVAHLLPLARSEVLRFERHPETLGDTLLSGGYPRIFDRGIPPADWLRDYTATYVERDVRAVSRIGDLTRFQRFLGLCAGRTSQLLNLSSLASDCGMAQPTAKAWLSVLEAGFIAFRLPPYRGSIRKRLVKMPKLHFYDTGLVCWLLGIRSVDHLRAHPLRGAIFETWVVSEILKHRTNRGESGGMFFYRDRSGAEADLILDVEGRLVVIEARVGETVTSEMLQGLRRIREILEATGDVEPVVVYGGGSSQDRGDVTALPWDAIHERSWA